MQPADDDNDDHKNFNPNLNPNGQFDHDSSLANLSNFGIDYWQKRFATVAPTIYPLRSSSHPVVDASVTRRFLVPSQGVILDNGIKLSTIVALAYGLVLRAHSDAPNEVVFGYIRHPDR